ncbi:glycoside hydrolase family 13 protein [Microbacterium lacticum]
MHVAARRPHHDGSPLYVSHADPRLGDDVAVRLRVPDGYGPVARVLVRSNPDHEPAWVEAVRDGAADGWEWWTATIRVANPRHGYRFHLVLADGRVEVLSQGGLSDVDALDAQDFALVAGNPPPSWMDDTVLYQIFPDRFARSEGADARATPQWAIPARWDEPLDPVHPGRGHQFYGGDLDGAAARLDHLVDLGVTALYHTPVFPAESNHRYDASRFDAVDPFLGGDAAYLRLIEAAHARGIRVIGDLTTNHSGAAHEWFRAAFGDPDAPEGEFYYFLDDAHTRYETWLDAATLPKFDWNSAELRRRFIEGVDSVVARWLRPPFSIDGWRIDVANMTGRLGDEDLNTEVRRTLRRTMIEVSPDTLLLAESTNDAATDLQGDAWHGGMTYPAFTRGVWAWLGDPLRIPHLGADGELTDDMWFFGLPTGMPRYDAHRFVAQYERFSSQIPWRVQRGTMSALDTHDTARFATYAAPGAVPVAVGLSMTLPGIPVVYAGDEFGLEAVDGEMSRTPLPWDRIDEPDIAARIALYHDLIGLRRAHPVLATGGLRWIHVDEGAVVFARESADETVLVLATRGGVDAVLPAPLVVGAEHARALYGDAELTAAADGSVRIAAAGTAFAAWSLPGVTAPAPSAPGVHAPDAPA